MALNFNETTEFESKLEKSFSTSRIEPTTTEMTKSTKQTETPTTELWSSTAFSEISDKLMPSETFLVPTTVKTTVSTSATTTSTITTTAKRLEFTTISQRNKDLRRVSKKK